MNDNTHAVRVYAPEQSELVPFIRGYLAEAFGGCTTYEARGDWVADNGEMVTENTKVVESVTDHERPAEKAKDAAERAKAQDWHDEDAIMWEIRPITAVGYE